MGFNHATIGTASWPILLAVALMLLGVWLGASARSRHTRSGHRQISIDEPETSPRTQPIYSDAPTVRLDDSQRVDRLHRVLTLKVGEHADLLDLTFDRIPRLRVTFVGLDEQHARIHIELGGAIAGCGSLVKELAANQFLLPCAAQDEQRASILHFQGKDDEVSFLRIKVTRIRPELQSIDVDVLHVCGNWNA